MTWPCVDLEARKCRLRGGRSVLGMAPNKRWSARRTTLSPGRWPGTQKAREGQLTHGGELALCSIADPLPYGRWGKRGPQSQRHRRADDRRGPGRRHQIECPSCMNNAGRPAWAQHPSACRHRFLARNGSPTAERQSRTLDRRISVDARPAASGRPGGQELGAWDPPSGARLAGRGERLAVVETGSGAQPEGPDDTGR